MKKRKARREVDRLLRPERPQQRQWSKLGSIDLSKAFTHEAGGSDHLPPSDLEQLPGQGKDDPRHE